MHKHVAVGGQAIKPMFKGKDDPDYKRMLAWIKLLKGPVHPIYNISYKPLIVEPTEEEEPDEGSETDEEALNVPPTDEPTEESTDEP